MKRANPAFPKNLHPPTSMKHSYLLSPSAPDVGLTTVSLGLARALQRRGVSVGFHKPIAQDHNPGHIEGCSIHYAKIALDQKNLESISFAEAQTYFREGRVDDLMERIIALHHKCTRDFDVVVLEGLITHAADPVSSALNKAVARTLGSDVVLVDRFEGGDVEALEERLRTAGAAYGGLTAKQIIGCVLNKVRCPAVEDGKQQWADYLEKLRDEIPLVKRGVIHLIGCIPENPVLRRFRTLDVVKPTEARILREGDLATRRVDSVHLLARTVPNLLNSFRPNALLLTPADRVDIIMATALASTRGIQLAGLVLTGEAGKIEPDEGVMELCSSVADPGLPVLMAYTNSFHVVSVIENISPQIPADDPQRLNTTLDFIARHMDCRWMVEEHLAKVVEKRISPPAFRFRLAERARAADKRILLPEGTEPRILRAAIDCHKRGIARCVLLGNPGDIRDQTRAIGESLPESVEIIDADAVRARYVPTLVEMRKHKNLTEKLAFEYLENNTYLATIMLALDEADGLVAGVSHSTADTIRPALQLIRTAPHARVVSSVFFMCLPDQVLVYGDCAVNPDPDAEMLADIALRSAESAETFGIPPRVALISYSTGTSGAGADVEKVRTATRIAREMRPDLPIDGPLQYDAAAIPSIAEKKAPGSPVAGRATVFVFPDLNTGNTTYKAVQRSANVISIGPMLQGLDKPVNDLSRGALVDDIIYTIALTAVQAEQRRKAKNPPATPTPGD